MLPKTMGIVRWRRGLEFCFGGMDEGWGFRVCVLDCGSASDALRDV
jgi:hypothetical protein